MAAWKSSTVHLAALMFAALTAGLPVRARAPSLDDIVGRVATYAMGYGSQLGAVVAEEQYTQWIERVPGTATVPALGATRRVIRSDFVLIASGEGDTWVGLRDAFEVDGVPQRDREQRLLAVLTGGGEDAWGRAVRIANESARFNIGSTLITRNINVPTFVLQLLHGPNRTRFRFSLAKSPSGSARATEPAPGRGDTARVEIEYRERDRPTLVRQRNGADQPLRGTVSVNPETGGVWRTHLTWERGPGGAIDVTFGRAPAIDVLVPVRMFEAYSSAPAVIYGDATYSNFRRFVTSVRVVAP